MIEPLVTSLETSKKLAEIGLKRETVFYWFRQFKEDDYLLHYIDSNHYDADLKIFKDHFPDCFPAYTAQEIGKELPFEVRAIPIKISKEDYSDLSTYVWRVTYSDQEEMLQLKNGLYAYCLDLNLAECLGKMRLLLSESGYPLCD